MKDILSNMNDAYELVNQVADFDSVGMLSIICMLIDTFSAKYDEDPKKIADLIRDKVHEVNDTLGRYEI